MKRLFEQFQPEHYELHLIPVRDNMTFSGNVIIRGRKVGRPSQRITFHQNGLKITSAAITRHDKKGKQTFEVVRINNHNTLNEVRLHAGAMLFPGEYTVKLEFSGKITAPMHGIYPCFFKHDGQEKSLIATQFESHHAREAFPCIDEPEAKATFDLTLTTPVGETVLANTPIKNHKNTGDTQTIQFETTPKMSTYLLAFVFGEIHGVNGQSKNGIEVSSWATVAQPKSHLNYANQEAIDVLNFLEDYFEVPFPLPKLDQVALPDFDSLAMENWGLITFREVGLLADPINRSISGERLITQVIAHELSHQWFGNLVTMKWWDELWLNESFATIMESLVPDKLHPEWHEWEDFTSGRVLGAANRDIYKDVQPVGVRVKHPDEILSLFDPSIVYAKGARLLKMMFDYIGEDNFKKGLRSYFKKFAYQNTERDDLWNELGQVSGIDIDALMTPWIEQSGTPLLSIERDGSRLSLSQRRFLLDGEDNTTTWPIPLLATTKLQPDIMTQKSLLIDQENKTDSVIFNPTGSAHFITHYDNQTDRDELKVAITNRTLDPSGRIIAINDMLLQARKGNEPLSEILDIVRACNKEDRDSVWSAFTVVISHAQRLTEGDEAVERQIKNFKQNLASHWYKKLGWDDKKNDDTNTKHLRTTAVALSIAGENEEAIATALARFKQAKLVENLPAEQRAIIAGAAVRFGKPEVIDQLMQEYVSSDNPDIQSAITSALCSTRDANVAEKIVKWGMADFTVIRPQDIDHWFAYLLGNQHTREVAWQWLVDSWSRLEEVSGDSKKMEYFIWYASRPFSTKDWQQKFADFFTPKCTIVALERNIKIALSEIEARVAWRNREEPLLKQYFLK